MKPIRKNITKDKKIITAQEKETIKTVVALELDAPLHFLFKYLIKAENRSAGKQVSHMVAKQLETWLKELPEEESAHIKNKLPDIEKVFNKNVKFDTHLKTITKLVAKN